MRKRASLVSISVLLLAMIAASTDAKARVDNQGITGPAQIALGHVSTGAGSTPIRHRLLIA